MTQMHAVRLSTRLISAWLIYRAATGLLAAVQSAMLVFSGIFSWVDGVKPGRYESSVIAGGLLLLFEVALEVFFAVVFYRCGPRLLRFLTGEAGEAQADGQGASEE